jgi:GNAT superfamily N-acetyltransferase
MTREERVTLAAYRGFSDAVQVGSAVVLRVPEGPGSPMMNRILGLGVDAPASEEQLDTAIASFEQATTFYVAVAPGAEPPELPGWLEARGLERGWGWMAFRRGTDVPETHRSSIRLADVESDEQRTVFASIVREGYGLPEAVEHRIALAPGVGWDCLLALDGDEPVGAAGTFVSEGAAYLGFAATLAHHRGKGAQSALLVERIRRAIAARCDVLLTETGERRDDLPSNSYRNILRAGFEEVAVTAHWVGTAR